MIEVPKPLRWLTLVIRDNELRRLYLPSDLYDVLEKMVCKLQLKYPTKLIHFTDANAYREGYQNFIWKGIPVCSR